MQTSLRKRIFSTELEKRPHLEKFTKRFGISGGRTFAGRVDPALDARLAEEVAALERNDAVASRVAPRVETHGTRLAVLLVVAVGVAIGVGRRRAAAAGAARARRRHEETARSVRLHLPARRLLVGAVCVSSVVFACGHRNVFLFFIYLFDRVFHFIAIWVHFLNEISFMLQLQNGFCLGV